jgi:phospholipid/cholesterol/gamma-HCH transport system substrate-binding protein
VGITVLVASTILFFLVFLMSGGSGLFTPKIHLKSYFDNASGLRVGAPVRLAGVDIGNVQSIRVVANHGLTPVEVTMRVSTKFKEGLRKDSHSKLATAGVLGETFVDIESKDTKLAAAADWDELSTEDTPDLQDMVRAGQGSLQNIDVLIKRLDRILAYVENGQGSVGKAIYDPALFNRLNTTVNEMQTLVAQVNAGKGTLGKLVVDEEMYHKAVGAIDKLNTMLDDINAGKGTAGKLIKDDSLYKNANETLAQMRKFTEDVNAGKGTLGKLAHDDVLANKIDATVTRLQAITEKVDRGEGTVGRLFKDQSLYENSDKMLVETRELLKAIRQDPKKYLSIKLHVF